MKQQSLEDILYEAEISEDTAECIPCRIAAGIGITKNLCEEFKDELDCRELAAMVDNPGLYTLSQIQAAIEKISGSSHGKPKELLDYTLCLMKGECSLPDESVGGNG